MFVAERFYNIYCCKVLSYKLPEDPITFSMQYPEVPVLNNKSIIDQIPYAVYSFFSPYTPDINFRFEIDLPDTYLGISFSDSFGLIYRLFLSSDLLILSTLSIATEILILPVST